MSLNDSAGISINILDKSQVPASTSPNALYAAAAIEAERGFINHPYSVDRNTFATIFGKKNFRKYGTAAQECAMYMRSGQRMVISRAGADTSKVAYIEIAKPSTTITYTGKTDVIGTASAPSGTAWMTLVARGEGPWSSAYDVKIEKTAATTDKYQSGDKDRIFYVRVYTHDSVVAHEADPLVPLVVVEEIECSMTTSDVNAQGISIYVENAVNDNSDILMCFVNSTLTDVAQLDYATAIEFGDHPGTIEYSVSKATDYENALKTIVDFPEQYNCFLALNTNAQIAAGTFAGLCEGNGRIFGIGCVKAALGLSNSATADTYVTARGTDYTGSNKWAYLLSDWVLVTEDETGIDFYVPSTGAAGYVIARQFNNGQLPYAPSGLRRGDITGCGVKGVFRVWNGASRVTLTDAQYNPLKADRQGIALWEELTMQTTLSAFSNAHVMLSTIAQIRSMNQTLSGYEFEFNDADTINSIDSVLKPLAAQFVAEKYAEQIIVDYVDNVIGSDVIKINWRIRYKGVAREVQVNIIAYPSTKDINVSISELG